MLSRVQNFLGRRSPDGAVAGTGRGCPDPGRLCPAVQRRVGGELACPAGVAVSEEARAILYLARRRGAIEIKGVNHAFESSERFLAVCVELDLDRTFILKRRDDPELTVRFLDGFRQLCASGLVMHHLFRDFSLTRRGFEVARSIRREDGAGPATGN